MTPLHLAAAYSSQETASVLLSNGADVSARTWHYNTPGHFAVDFAGSEGGVELLSILIEADLDLNAQNDGTAPCQELEDRDIITDRAIYPELRHLLGDCSAGTDSE